MADAPTNRMGDVHSGVISKRWPSWRWKFLKKSHSTWFGTHWGKFDFYSVDLITRVPIRSRNFHQIPHSLHSSYCVSNESTGHSSCVCWHTVFVEFSSRFSKCALAFFIARERVEKTRFFFFVCVFIFIDSVNFCHQTETSIYVFVASEKKGNEEEGNLLNNFIYRYREKERMKTKRSEQWATVCWILWNKQIWRIYIVSTTWNRIRDTYKPRFALYMPLRDYTWWNPFVCDALKYWTHNEKIY